MASPRIFNPPIPYVGIIDGGFTPGKMVRIQGTVPHSANRFAINLQCGPNTSPRDDIALHVSLKFSENHITRNSLHGMSWGIEENHGHMPLARGHGFEIIILCDPSHYKIAVNGQHYAEFGHRMPYQIVNYLAIDGEVSISLIQYEGDCSVPGAGVGFAPPPVAPIPPLPVSTGVPYPPNPAYPMAPGSYGPPPPHGPGVYAYQPGYGQGYPGGTYPKSHHGGGAKAALGAGLAGAALTGHKSPKKAMKSQKKAHKKALKYGLPVAAAGVGAYALHKGFHHHHGHHHHGSSSSSSSSSSEEE